MALAFVQGKASGGSSGSQTVTFGASTTAGNTIVVLISEFYSFTTYSFTVSVSDGSNTYLEALKRDNGGGAYSPSIRIMYAENAASVPSVTCNDPAGQYGFIAMEFSGGATSSSLDQAGGYAQQSGASNYASGNITTTQADEILIGFHLIDTASALYTVTPAGGFTSVCTPVYTNAVPASAAQYLIVSSTGTYNSTGQWFSLAVPQTGVLDNVIVSFKAAGGGASGTPFIHQLGVMRF